jgi:spore germination cell wall hydrolase CwlJ-like protein
MKNQTVFALFSVIVFLIIAYYLVLIYFMPSLIINSPAQNTSTYRDIVLLSSIINSEANPKDKKDMYLIGSTVLNRLDSEEYPNTISEVISESGQYDGYMTARFNRTPQSDYVAIDLLGGLGRDYCVLFFYNPRTATDTQFINAINKQYLLVDSTTSHLFFGE